MVLTPKNGADSATISINGERIYIDGTHYRFAYGYLSRRTGQFAVNLRDILSAGFIKGRPKPALMGCIGCGLLIPVLKDICDKLRLPDTVNNTGTAFFAVGFVLFFLGYLFVRRDLFEIAAPGHRFCVKCRHYAKDDIASFRTAIYKAEVASKSGGSVY